QWEAARHRLEATWRLAQSLNPDTVLDRGYARITTRAGETLVSAESARTAVALTLRFRDGAVDAIVAADDGMIARPKAERACSKPPAVARGDQPTLL
ncbi:hypothetical protein, partial [Escherichia coli]|uniref:hypothetical protein n=1 Tax=Escherichia coli TaxID=562 RepID=UPI003CE580C4